MSTRLPAALLLLALSACAGVSRRSPGAVPLDAQLGVVVSDAGGELCLRTAHRTLDAGRPVLLVWPSAPQQAVATRVRAPGAGSCTDDPEPSETADPLGIPAELGPGPHLLIGVMGERRARRV